MIFKTVFMSWWVYYTVSEEIFYVKLLKQSIHHGQSKKNVRFDKYFERLKMIFKTDFKLINTTVK